MKALICTLIISLSFSALAEEKKTLPYVISIAFEYDMAISLMRRYKEKIDIEYKRLSERHKQLCVREKDTSDTLLALFAKESRLADEEACVSVLSNERFGQLFFDYARGLLRKANQKEAEKVYFQAIVFCNSNINYLQQMKSEHKPVYNMESILIQVQERMENMKTLALSAPERKQVKEQALKLVKDFCVVEKTEEERKEK